MIAVAGGFQMLSKSIHCYPVFLIKWTPGSSVAVANFTDSLLRGTHTPFLSLSYNLPFWHWSRICPEFILNLFQVYLEPILILSWVYPEFIMGLFRVYHGFNNYLEFLLNYLNRVPIHYLRRLRSHLADSIKLFLCFQSRRAKACRLMQVNVGINSI